MGFLEGGSLREMGGSVSLPPMPPLALPCMCSLSAHPTGSHVGEKLKPRPGLAKAGSVGANAGSPARSRVLSAYIRAFPMCLVMIHLSARTGASVLQRDPRGR